MNTLVLPAYVNEETAAILRDRAQMVELYTGTTQEELKARLGIGKQTLRKVLVYHGIDTRHCDTPEQAITRENMKAIVQRSYLKANRCPPNCPGRCNDTDWLNNSVGCLDDNGKCVYVER